jgi:predicted helicase
LKDVYTETYTKDSTASNRNALSDVYVKFFRWATDRLQKRDGIVCLVTNNSFAHKIAFDGMRKHLLTDFTKIYHIDLHGDVRQNPKISGTTHNVFGIQLGVGITVAVRSSRQSEVHRLFFHRVPDFWRKEEKLRFLSVASKLARVEWKAFEPDTRNTWLVPKHAEEFSTFLKLGSKESKTSKRPTTETIFKVFSGGVKTNRDDVAYDFSRQSLSRRAQEFVEEYNAEVDRYKRSGKGKQIDDFVRYDRIKWSRDLKLDLQRGNYADFNEQKIRSALYRPFSKKCLFLDRILNEEVYVIPQILPGESSERENRLICCTNEAQIAFSAILTNTIPCLHLGGRQGQCFPFYVCDEDGAHRRENITDWALEQFRAHYQDKKISKWDIFYYAYGMLHHSGYREKFADNLKRELPRLPFAKDFRAFSAAGKELARLHLDYEQMKPFPLKWIESKDVPLCYRVEDKMRLSKDKKSLTVNPSLTLSGIPPEVFQYRLGNRSALEWVIDQYQVTEDNRTGIRSDPNRADDEEYIVRLVGQVIQVSLETVRIVSALPKEYSG